MGDLADNIIRELTEKFERHNVWVWFDAQKKYEGVIDDIEAALEDVTVAKYDGSFFALKRRLWEEDPDIDGNWLFYIPASRNEAEWFRDIQKLGRQYRVTADIDDSPVAKYLVEHEAQIPDTYADWGQNTETQRTAFFCVLFDTAAPDVEQWIRTYLKDPEQCRETIEEYAMEDAWDAQLREEYGVDAGLDATEIASQLLFGEVAHSAPTPRYDELAAEDMRAARTFVEEWQRLDKDTFTHYAREIGEGYDLEAAVLESENVRWEATAFEGIDEGLIQLVMKQLSEETHATLPALASQIKGYVDARANGFWSNEDLVDWSVPQQAVATLAEIKSLDPDKAVKASPRELAEMYTAEDGWWTIDTAYRTFINATQTTRYPYPHESAVKSAITKHYMDFLKAVNRPLADPLSEEPSVASPQTEFFETYAQPENGKAVIVCDGLRYELAEAVRDRLSRRGEFEQDLAVMSAALPSITEVGMAAHLPGQLGLGLEDDELTVTVDGERMRHKSDRTEVLNNAGYEVNSLSSVGDTPLEELKSEDPIPRIVYSGTIDKLGESLDDADAFSRVGTHVDAVERAIQRLKQAGYTEFVVTSDHGFLYTDRLSDGLKVESPALAVDTNRRFAVADDDAPLVETQEYVQMGAEALSTLGIDAQGLKLLFPRSVACFKARGGNMQYFHGGISLQELLVPCLRITTEELEDSGSVSYNISIPDPITNSIVTVEIEAKTEQLSFDRPLEIRAIVDDEDAAEPVEVDITPGANSTRVNLKQGVIAGQSSVLFQIVDRDTREMIDQRTVGLDLLFGDDDMGFDV